MSDFELGELRVVEKGEFKGNVLKLHVLYLERLPELDSEDRALFRKYFTFLANPLVILATPELVKNPDAWKEK